MYGQPCAVQNLPNNFTATGHEFMMQKEFQNDPFLRDQSCASTFQKNGIRFRFCVVQIDTVLYPIRFLRTFFAIPQGRLNF